MKRILALGIAMVMTLTCSLITAAAVDAEGVGARASLTISSYNVTLKAGTSPGEIRINHTVAASKPADSVGVSSITIYRADGSYVATITGTTDNKLVRNSSSGNMGTYSYSAISGNSYYAEVTVFATIGDVTDSRTVTTATVKAP